jgi:hypothetical protein
LLVQIVKLIFHRRLCRRFTGILLPIVRGGRALAGAAGGVLPSSFGVTGAADPVDPNARSNRFTIGFDAVVAW